MQSLYISLVFIYTIRHKPRPTLFPYTTLFRSFVLGSMSGPTWDQATKESQWRPAVSRICDVCCRESDARMSTPSRAPGPGRKGYARIGRCGVQRRKGDRSCDPVRLPLTRAKTQSRL